MSHAGADEVGECPPDGQTADHGMNAKTRALDLGRILAGRGITGAMALSIEKDGIVGHHRDLGGGAWVWTGEADRDRAAEILASLDGVEEVIPRAEAAARFVLDPSRMGDFAVLADRRSVFGDLTTETEDLPPATAHTVPFTSVRSRSSAGTRRITDPALSPR